MESEELFGCFNEEASKEQTSPMEVRDASVGDQEGAMEVRDASGGDQEGAMEVQVHEEMQEESCAGERNLMDKEFSPDVSERLFRYKSVKGMLTNVPVRGKYLDTQPYVTLRATVSSKDSLVVRSLLSVEKKRKETGGSKASKRKKRNLKKFKGTEDDFPSSGDDIPSKKFRTTRDMSSDSQISDDDSYLSDPHLEPSSDSSPSDHKYNWNHWNVHCYDSESSEENYKYVKIYPPESPEPQDSKKEASPPPVDEVKEQVPSGSAESRGSVSKGHLVEQRIANLQSESAVNSGSPMDVEMTETMEGDRDEGDSWSSPGGSLKKALGNLYKEGESMRLEAESNAAQEENRSCFFLSGESKVNVKRIEALESTCVHEVAVPPNTEFEPLKSAEGKPAKTYSFLLDPFQKEAILCIENNQSVLVSAHTSAGKTVVAEYSIALALGLKQRVIYTTPIKALSNQKFREFSEEFIDVGLITGDVTINPTASCLIMTTEILRNMLYHGSEVMREVSWVIFDEIHYMRDKERGVVWEETLILLPDNVHYVFLSATIPNARQFAEWVCFIHRQPCHVVYTEYRPTPLQHYIYPTGSDGIHLVVNENGEFLEGNFDAAMKLLENETGAGGGNKKFQGASGGRGNQVPCFKLIKMVMERNLSPAIIFSFSKKDCELYAMQTAKLDLITKEEKILVDEVFQNAMMALSEDDKTLPQVENVVPLLRRGIGIHHGGLLPILKETIEVLFSEGLIKALFATETFAMGLNMPAKTVLFTSSRKFDGHDHRYITSGEYIQMSGRAGRRGLDDKGTVILMVDEKLTPSVGRSLLQGKADPLNSAFHLTNNMILNLLRVDSINPEYMLERSFFQFQNVADMPELEKKLKHLTDELFSINIPKEKWVQEFHKNKKLLNTYEASLHKLAFKPRRLLPFLTPGRLLKVRSDDSGYSCWGILMNCKQLPTNPNKEEPDLLLDVLLPSDSELSLTEKEKELKSKIVDMEVQSVAFANLQAVSQIRLNESNDIRLKHNRLKLAKIIKGIGDQFNQKIPELDPIEDFGAKSPLVNQLIRDINFLRKKVNLPCYKTEEFLYSHRQYMAKLKLMKEIDGVNDEIKRANSLLQMKELRCRKRVLRRMGFCTETDVIKLKGRVACELSSTEELVLTELLFSNLFGTLSPPHAAALLSTFVCDERSSDSVNVMEELTAGLRMLHDTANVVFKAYEEANLGLDRDEFLAMFKPTMMNIVFAWARGEPFYKICQMTDIFEGSIIRCLRRLEELLRQLVQAAKVMGNVNLENLFSEGIRLIKRDIVFAASLYL